jgi:hypothetical protein
MLMNILTVIALYEISQEIDGPKVIKYNRKSTAVPRAIDDPAAGTRELYVLKMSILEISSPP